MSDGTIRKAALAGFLVVQVVVLALYVSALLPHIQSGKAIISEAAESWSGGAYSDVSTNFRSGTSLLAYPYDPYGSLMWATILWVGAAIGAVAALLMFRRSRVWIAAGLAVAALGAGAGAASMIATQWSGDTTFPPHFTNATLLYALAKAFNTQFLIGFALLALSAVALIGGLATKEKPYGFHVVALNWIVVAATWVISYLALYVAPPLFAGSQ